MKNITTLLLLFITNSILIAQNYYTVNDTLYLCDGETKIANFNPTINDNLPCSSCEINIDNSAHGVFENLGNNLNYSFNLTDSNFIGFDSVIYIAKDIVTYTNYTGKIFIKVSRYCQNQAYEHLNINNIEARINSNGSLFFDGKSSSTYNIPNDSTTTTFFSNYIWVGGINQSSGGVHFAGGEYGNNGHDFQQGPLCNVPEYYNQKYKDEWNRLWKITKEEINEFRIKWNTPNYQVPEVILSWPGNGDLSKGQSQFIAPYHDNDHNNKYEPLKGDYPLIKGDQAIFFIFNDDRNHSETNSNRLKTEIHAMAYAYNCPSNPSFNNTIFIDYKFINRSTNTYKNTYIGMFSDIDIGGAEDDFVGCDVMRNSFYGYNGDDYDNNANGVKGYGYYPPAQSVTFVKGPKQDEDGIDNYIGYENDQSVNGFGYADGIIDNERRGLESFFGFFGAGATPSSAIDYYGYMSGKWRDGTQIIYGGTGHSLSDTALPAKFMFPGNTDPDHYGTNGIDPGYDWSESNTANGPNTPSDRRGVGSTGPFTFKPGDTQEITLAFVTGFGNNNLHSIEVMQSYIDDIILAYHKGQLACEFTSGIEENSELNNNLNFYPNPVQNNITIDAEGIKNITIYNQLGQPVLLQKYLSENSLINVEQLSTGMYFIKAVTSDNEVLFGKMEILR